MTHTYEAVEPRSRYFSGEITKNSQVFRETPLGLALADAIDEMALNGLMDDTELDFKERGFKDYKEVILSSFDRKIQERFDLLPIMNEEKYLSEAIKRKREQQGLGGIEETWAEKIQRVK